MAKHDILNLTGVPCPQNTARALLRMELLDEGEQLKIVVDDGEPITNFLEAMDFESAYRILEKNKQVGVPSWHIIIQRVK
jgi:TusA-related sulfurtransferase